MFCYPVKNVKCSLLNIQISFRTFNVSVTTFISTRFICRVLKKYHKRNGSSQIFFLEITFTFSLGDAAYQQTCARNLHGKRYTSKLQRQSIILDIQKIKLQAFFMYLPLNSTIYLQCNALRQTGNLLHPS